MVDPTLVPLRDFIAPILIGPGQFRGQPLEPGRFRLFGGQPMAQAVLAADQLAGTGFQVHSLHVYFVAAGDASQPVDYDVVELRRGRSFVTFRVGARQGGRQILEMTVSFQPLERGLEHQVAMPSGVPQPEDLSPDRSQAPTADDVRKATLGLQLRTVPSAAIDGHRQAPDDVPTRVWLKTTESLPDEHVVHAAILTYASDMMLLIAAGAPQGMSLGDPTLQCASLDHAMWFHRDFRIDDWLLAEVISPSLSGSRALTQGRVYRRDGALVATMSQEGLIRLVGETY